MARRIQNASIARGWDAASEWYRKRVLDASGVSDSSQHAKKKWKDLPDGAKRAVTGRPARNKAKKGRKRNVFETDRERAAFAAGLARGRADLSAAAEKLRRKKATRLERMTRSGLAK